MNGVAADSRVVELAPEVAVEQIRCPVCGELDSGRFCSNCGSELQPDRDVTYRSFAETFLKLGERRRYLATYAHVLRSPTRNSLELAGRIEPRSAFKFLEVSAFVYAVTALSRVLSFKYGVVGALVVPFSFALTWTISLWVTYRLARRKSPTPRASGEYLTLASIYLGFNLPPLGLAGLVQLVSPVLGGLVLLALVIPTGVYSIRLWKRFWSLSGWRVFGYLLAGSLLGGAADLILLAAVRAAGG